jgi:hypothetical protein
MPLLSSMERYIFRSRERKDNYSGYDRWTTANSAPNHIGIGNLGQVSRIKCILRLRIEAFCLHFLLGICFPNLVRKRDSQPEGFIRRRAVRVILTRDEPRTMFSGDD